MKSYFDKKHPFFDKDFPHTKPKMDEWESFMRNAYKYNRKKSFVILNWNKMPESVIRVLLNAPKPKITNSERHDGPKRRESFEK